MHYSYRLDEDCAVKPDGQNSVISFVIYLLFQMLPESLVFRPSVKGNEDSYLRSYIRLYMFIYSFIYSLRLYPFLVLNNKFPATCTAHWPACGGGGGGGG